MAVAISSEGGHDLVLSPLENRISSSQKGWERFQHELSREYPEHACSAPLVIERKRARWQITETMCVWVAFRRAIRSCTSTRSIGT